MPIDLTWLNSVNRDSIRIWWQSNWTHMNSANWVNDDSSQLNDTLIGWWFDSSRLNWVQPPLRGGRLEGCSVPTHPWWRARCAVWGCPRSASEWGAHWSGSCPDTGWPLGPAGCPPRGNTPACLGEKTHTLHRNPLSFHIWPQGQGEVSYGGTFPFNYPLAYWLSLHLLLSHLADTPTEQLRVRVAILS
jgi:hypothetical protein